MRRWAIGAVIVLIGGVFALSGGVSHAPRTKFCGDVGLMTDTYGATAREALEAYVRSRGGDPKGWRLHGNGFEAIDSHTRPQGLASIGASQDASGVWRVVGGCVGNFASAASRSSGPPPKRTTCAQIGVTITEGRAQPPMATWVFALTNASNTSCFFEGYPDVALSQNNYGLSFQFLRRRSGVLIAAPKAEEYSVAPGATVYFVLEKDACSPNDSILSGRADVYFGPRDAHASAAVPGRFALCGHDYNDDVVLQTPIVDKIDDAYLATPAPLRCRARDLEAQSADTREASGYTAWATRLVNIGATPCQLRGTPHFFVAPTIGMRTKRATHDGHLIRGGPATSLTLEPRSAAYLAFEKATCVKAEQAITLTLRPPASPGSLLLPLPAGLQKCDFKEPAGNTILFSPFATSAAATLR